MQLVCPKCGTRETRVSRRSGFGELFQGMFGVYPLRCRRCRNRWLTSVWAGGAWKYARCPRCYRQELTTWSEQYYHPPATIVAQLRLGATPYRCSACRCNFASFKPCREKFSWRHETKVDAPEMLEPEPVAELAATAGNNSASVHAAVSQASVMDVPQRDVLQRVAPPVLPPQLPQFAEISFFTAVEEPAPQPPPFDDFKEDEHEEPFL